MMKGALIFGAVAMLAMMIYATESTTPGLNILKASDGEVFSSEKLKGGGDTVWTRIYDFGSGGFDGVFSLYFAIDTASSCSSKVKILLQESNLSGTWALVTSAYEIDHAPADWDTVLDIKFLPTMFWRIGFVQTNGSNDSTWLSNVYLFGVGLE